MSKSKLTPEQSRALANYINSIDWSNPGHDEKRRALAKKIVEEVKDDVYSQQLVNVMATTRNFGPGEEIQFKTVEGLKAYVVDPGSYSPRSQVTNTVTTLPKKRITVSTELDLSQLRSGRYGDVADFRERAAEQILGAQNSMLWEVAYRAVTSSTTDSNYATIASGDSVSTKKSALDSAISHLEDYTDMGAKAIIGRYSALSWVDDVTNSYYPDSKREEIYGSPGMVRDYKGLPAVRLKSFKDAHGVQKISADHIIVLGEDVLKFGIVDPGLEVFERINGTTNYSWEIAFWIEVGAAAIQSDHMYHIEIT
jgi:hypothetical protein